MKYNTAIAAMMSLVNDFYLKGSITKQELHTLLTLLSPVAPHISEEIAEILGYGPLYAEQWPIWDESALVEDTVEMAIQINGKVRGHIWAAADANKEDIEKTALGSEEIVPLLQGKTVRKVVVVRNVVNIVV
jgi:leucyl-tRNA synthetase